MVHFYDWSRLLEDSHQSLLLEQFLEVLRGPMELVGLNLSLLEKSRDMSEEE